MIDLTGKRALITGASGGIGKAIALKLHELGAELTISGTRREKLDDLAAELGNERVHIVTCNLSDVADVKTLVPQTLEAMGGIDILVNNAGITKDGLSMRMSEEDWNNVITVNLTSAFLIAQACLRGMMKQRSGRIINISSVVGTAGNPGQANYVASKAGVNGLTKTLALELAPRGVTVNSVSPGFIKTPMTDKLSEEQQSSLAKDIPAGRFGDPEDISGIVAFLASDLSSYITGQTIHVNGGMLMI